MQGTDRASLSVMSQINCCRVDSTSVPVKMEALTYIISSIPCCLMSVKGLNNYLGPQPI